MVLFSKKYEDFIVKALGYMQLEQYENSEKLLLKAIKKNPNISDAYEYLGLLYFKTNKKQNSAEYYKKANDISGGILSQIYFNKGLIFYKRNLIEDAMIAFTKVNIMSENKYARYYLGQILSKTGNYKGAIEEYKDILKKHPDDIKSLEALGYIYFDLKIADQGINIFKKLINLNQNVPGYFFNIASLNKFLGNYPEAEKYFLLAYEKEPENYLNYLNLGDIYKLEGNLDKSEDMILKAIEKFPMDFMMYYEMGLIKMEKNEPDLALKYFLKSYELNTEDIYTINKIASIYQIKKELMKAQDFFKKSLKLNSRDPYTHFKYGELLTILGNKEEAKKEFNTVLSIEPNYIIAKIKLKELNN